VPADWRRKEPAMSTDNLILEHLRAIRCVLDRHTEDFREIKVRLGILESQYASLSNPLDRMDERAARIEKRLDLVEG
jgi:hypothetical protein